MTARRAVRSSRGSSTELVILGLLKRQPAHGYELLRIVRERNMREYIRVAPSGLYKALARLEDQGCVTSRVEREGSWPERQTYSITRRGEARLQKLLMGHLRGAFDHSDAISAGLTFGDLASSAELVLELRRRYEMILGSQVEADRLLAEVLPPSQETFFERLRVKRWAEHLAAERRWLDMAIGSIDLGARKGQRPRRANLVNGGRSRHAHDSGSSRPNPTEGGGGDLD
jgi:DNA-binding PadR family transcriptional regulator